MSSNGSNRDVVELWGRTFNIVRTGLSEPQVVSFVNDLVKQHDLLLQRQDHLSALTRLAERTVTEADKLAEEIKSEAKEDAGAESARIMADAQEAAKTRSEAMVNEMRSRAETEIAEKKQSRLAEADTEAKRVVNDAEAKARHIIEQQEAEAVTRANAIADDIVSKARLEAGGLLEREKQRIQPELNQFVLRFRSQLLSDIDQIKSQVGALEKRFQYPTAKASAGTKGQSAVQPDELLGLVDEPESVDSSDAQWEVEIVPPIDIMKIMSIVAHLDSQPSIARTEIIPRHDRTSVVVFGQDVIDLYESLKSLSEVGQIEKTGLDSDRPRKVVVSLSSGSDQRTSPTPDSIPEAA